MPRKGSSLFLVNSVTRNTVKRTTFRTDELIPQSGIYQVRHQKHRLPHEVTLFRDHQFPRCAQCHDAVIFELIRAVSEESDAMGFSTPIRVYELPVLDDEQELAS
jgi:hypothetical protein